MKNPLTIPVMSLPVISVWVGVVCINGCQLNVGSEHDLKSQDKVSVSET